MQKHAPTALKPIDGLATLIILACCCVWGANQVAIKLATDAIPPVLQAGLRSIVSGGLLVTWMIYRGLPILPVGKGSWLPALAAGTIFAFEFICLYVGLSLTGAARGVLLLYAMPFLVALGAHVLIPGDRLTLNKLLGLVLAFTGLGLALSENLLTGTGGQGTLVGDILCLLGAAGWAATTLIVRTTPLKSEPAETQLLCQLGVSIPVLFVASLVLAERNLDVDGLVSGRDATAWLAFAYTCVIVAFVSYVTWFWLLSRHPATSVSVFTFLTPILGALFAALLLAEPLSPLFLAALVLVAGGILLVNRPAR